VSGDGTALVAEMVVNIRDSPVEKFVSRDVILLPQLVPACRPLEHPVLSSSLSSSSADAATMHHDNNKVTEGRQTHNSN